MERLLSAQQVAAHRGLHVKTLYKLVRENRIALNFIRVHNRSIAFRPADVEAYIRDREVVRTGDSPKRARGPAQPEADGTHKLLVKTVLEYRYFNDAEAQEFFANVERDEDGSVMCSPEN